MDTETKIQWVVISVLAILLVYNGVRIYDAGNLSGNPIATGIGTVSALDISPKGIPAVYGAELGISYDDINPNNAQSTNAAMQKLTQYEDMQLDSTQLERYVKIGSSIACEYCCGANTLVFSDGSRACSCAHSYAMRGLIKYLLTKHPEMTDLQILDEAAKWKVLFFPGPEQSKAETLKANGIDYTNFVNLASNLYRGVENQQAAASSGSSSSQVGSC